MLNETSHSRWRSQPKLSGQQHHTATCCQRCQSDTKDAQDARQHHQSQSSDWFWCRPCAPGQPSLRWYRAWLSRLQLLFHSKKCAHEQHKHLNLFITVCFKLSQRHTHSICLRPVTVNFKGLKKDSFAVWKIDFIMSVLHA